MNIYDRVLDPHIAAYTRGVLRRVVTEGTGRRAASRLYELFGKSGTAQVSDPENGGYLEDHYVSSFIAGAPLESPRVAVLCLIHRPDVAIAHHGGTVAGPAVKRVVEQTLAYLGVAPSSGPRPDPAQLVAHTRSTAGSTRP